MAMCSWSGVFAQLVLQTAMSFGLFSVLITIACSTIKPSLPAMHFMPCELLFVLNYSMDDD